MMKNTIRSLLRAYDDVLYALWRAFGMLETKQAPVLLHKPLISIVVPVYDTDISFLGKMIDSVRSQVYQEWELILVDDASPTDKVRRSIESYAVKDWRIRYKFLSENHHIAGATNIAIKMANGTFIGLLDHDDLLHPEALLEVAKAINKNPNASFFYTDEDKIIGTRHTQPFFKPDWNLGLLHCVNYITHFAVISKAQLEKMGYEDGSYNGAQDWELFLRLGRSIDEKDIIHIPRILYSWRVHSLSTSVSLDAKPYVLDAQIRAVSDDLKERGIKAAVRRNEKYPGQLTIEGRESSQKLNIKDLLVLLGLKRTLFIMLSSKMALSRHLYRTTSYDKIEHV